MSGFSYMALMAQSLTIRDDIFASQYNGQDMINLDIVIRTALHTVMMIALFDLVFLYGCKIAVATLAVVFSALGGIAALSRTKTATRRLFADKSCSTPRAVAFFFLDSCFISAIKTAKPMSHPTRAGQVFSTAKITLTRMRDNLGFRVALVRTIRTVKCWRPRIGLLAVNASSFVLLLDCLMNKRFMTLVATEFTRFISFKYLSADFTRLWGIFLASEIKAFFRAIGGNPATTTAKRFSATSTNVIGHWGIFLYGLVFESVDSLTRLGVQSGNYADLVHSYSIPHFSQRGSK
jgi:hypothetical protein